MNVKVLVAYDGSCYKGSQKQPNKQSIENKLEEAFACLNIYSKIILSGRTDKDVHATGQVFNIEIPSYWNDLKKLERALNNALPSSIVIKHINQVTEDFHARFHAKKRVYRYLLSTKKMNPFSAKYITHVPSLNEELIKDAIKCFIGVHDFEYFHKLGSDKENLVREIFDATCYKYKDVFVLRFEANSYLRSQIRLMVGFLLAISDRKLSIDDLKQQLAKEKRVHKLPALANGLYLAKVYY